MKTEHEWQNNKNKIKTKHKTNWKSTCVKLVYNETYLVRFSNILAGFYQVNSYTIDIYIHIFNVFTYIEKRSKGKQLWDIILIIPTKTHKFDVIESKIKPTKLYLYIFCVHLAVF